MSLIDSFRKLFVGPEQATPDFLAYCEQRGFGLEDRLRLFDEVCELVQANHERDTYFRRLSTADIFVLEANGTRTIEIAGETLHFPRACRPLSALSAAVVAEAADVWRLGELLANALAPMQALPRRLEDIVEQAVSPGRTRTQSVFDLRAQIRAYVHGQRMPEMTLPRLDPRPRSDRYLTPLPV